MKRQATTLALALFACSDPSQTPDDPIPDGPTAQVTRGGDFFGVTERFNRYYTDSDYESSRIIFVSQAGGGDGTSRENPLDVDSAISQVQAGEQITFVADESAYYGCWELDGDSSGTYDAPIVLYAERNADGSRGVHINCCDDGRSTCFNLEYANYVAVDGFELEGDTACEPLVKDTLQATTKLASQ